MMTSRYVLPAITSLTVAAGCSGSMSGLPTAKRQIDPQRLAVFTPKHDGGETTIDFAPLDTVFKDIVLVSGPSLRRRASKPRTPLGSRIPRGHNSALRLEGNKIIFSILNDAAKDLIYKMTDAMVALPDRVDLTAMHKDEQLAYWYNVHNLLVISTILKNYPAASPSKLNLGDAGLPFHDAPLAVIKGVPLSLRDIRIGIVYAHWKDPRVIYGFFHGDIASPNVRSAAWKGDSVWDSLDANADEFVNSLRGVRKGFSTLAVSPLYQEARAPLFPNWPDDLRDHIERHAKVKVANALAKTVGVSFSRYEHRTADLVGGQDYFPQSSTAATAVGPLGYASGLDRMYLYPLSSPHFVTTYTEYMRKFEDMKRVGEPRFSTTVTIVDIKPETPSAESKGTESGKEDKDEKK